MHDCWVVGDAVFNPHACQKFLRSVERTMNHERQRDDRVIRLMYPRCCRSQEPRSAFEAFLLAIDLSRQSFESVSQLVSQSSSQSVSRAADKTVGGNACRLVAFLTWVGGLMEIGEKRSQHDWPDGSLPSAVGAVPVGQNHEQEAGESDLTKNAFKILYATDEDPDAAPHPDGPESHQAAGEVCWSDPLPLAPDRCVP